MKKRRSRFGLQLVAMGNIIRSINTDEKPKYILLINDQSPPKKDKGKIVSFLHQPTVFYDKVEQLASRYDVEIMYLKTTIQEQNYLLSIEPLNKENIILDYAQKLERDILENPSYWLWSHNRWKHEI